MMSEVEEQDGKKPSAAGEEVAVEVRRTRKKRPRGPPTEAERQFAAAAVQVMSGGATPEAQHAFLLLHPRLLPATPSSPSSARRATRRLFQLWLRELTSTISVPGQQASADDLLKRQSLLSFIHVWAKHFHGDLSPSRCSSAIKLLSLVLAPSHSTSTTPPLSPSSSSSPSSSPSADGAAASPKRRPSLNDEHRRMLNEFKLLFLQHRGAARSVAERLLESGAGSSPPLSPSLPSRASVSLASSPSLHVAASAPLASTPLLHSSASSVPALRSSTSPRARHSVAVASIAAAAEDMGDAAQPSLQSRSAEMPVVASVDKAKGRLYTSDETNLASGSHHQDSVEGKTSPRDTTSASDGGASDGSDEHSTTARDGGRRRGRNSAHVRSDSVGAILSITQRPGGRRTPRLRFLDVPLEILAEEMLMHAVGPREFLDQGWQKNVELNMAPNITAIIDRFNQVSFWTTTEVLTKDTPQLMAKTIKRFIKLAGMFHEMNNFNSLMEIVSGLNSAAIQRLTVWKELPDKYARRFREMDALMQMKQNYRSYRERLAELLPFLLAGSSSSATSPASSSLQTSLSLSIASVTSSVSQPASPASSTKKGSAGKVVPYFAVFLRDVTFAMVGNPLYLPPPRTSSTPTIRPRRRLSESDADAKNADDAVEQESGEEDTDATEEARGRETPIEGGTINMDRVQLMYDQVQTFQLLRHEMRGYEFLERVKREKEDKEFLRRLIREYQADLRAITNADLLYDLSLAAEGNALTPNALSTSPSSSSSVPRSTARLSMAPSPPPPPTTTTLRSSTSPRASTSSADLRSSASSTSTRQALPSLVSAFSSLASSSSAAVISPNTRTHRLSVSMSLSPPLSPASSSPVVSSAYLRGSSGTIRVRSASDDAGAAVDIDTGDDDTDDDDDTDEEAFFLEIEAKQQQPAVTPKQSAKATTTTRKSRLRRKDVLSMRRVASSPDNNNNSSVGDEHGATGPTLLQHKQTEEKPAPASKRSGSRTSFRRRNSEPEPEPSPVLPTLGSSSDLALPSINGELFTSGSSIIRPLSPSASSSSTSSPPLSPSMSTSKGSSRREFTFHKGKANISDGDLVSKVAVEVRSFVGNVSRPLLLTFRDTLDDFLAKAGLRHDHTPVVSFIYEAPSARSAASGSGSSSAVVATTAPSLAAAVAGATGRKGEKLVVEDDEGFQTFKRWALQQSERATIDVWLFVGVY